MTSYDKVYFPLIAFWYPFSVGACAVYLMFSNLPDGFDHLKPHVDTVVGVVWSRHGQAAHTVVTITQDLDPHTLVVLQELQLGYYLLYNFKGWIYPKLLFFLKISP